MKKLLISLLVVVPFFAISQEEHPDWTIEMQSENVNFDDLNAQFNSYWEGKPHEKGDGYKPFMRWAYWAEKRKLENGKLRSADDYLRLFNEVQDYKSQRSLEGNWSELGPILDDVTTRDYIPGIGRVNAIEFHPTNPDKIFIGAPSGGLWVTENGGALWTAATDMLPTLGVSSIVIDPSNPDIIYIGTGDRDSADAPGLGVFKSTDGGETWEQENTGMGNLVVGMMEINYDDPSKVYAATNDGVYTSTNGGEFWELASNSNNFKDIKIHPTNPDIIYATGNTGFYKSEDGGQSFDFVPGDVSFNVRNVMGVCPQNPDLVYVCGANTTDFRGFFVSTDAGESFDEVSDSPNILGWSDLSSGGQAWYNFTMTVNPENELDIIVGGIRVVRSLDGGVTWNEISDNYIHVDQHASAFSPHTNNLWIGNDGGIYEYSDNSMWIDQSNGIVISQMYKLGQSPFYANNVLTGFQDNGTSEWDGYRWERRIGADGMECMYDHQDPDYQYGAIQNGEIRRTGPTYTSETCGMNGLGGITGNGMWVTPYTLDLDNSNTMYLGYSALWRCRNIKEPNIDEVTWQNITLSASATANPVSEICQSDADINLMYIAKSANEILRSDDVQADEPIWTNITGNLPPINSVIQDLEAHPFDPNVVYLSYAMNVYKSEDKGVTWNSITQTLPDVQVNSIEYDKNSDEGIYLGTELGVFYKDASMTDWISFSAGLPSALNISELEIYYGENLESSRLRGASYGRGLWESDLYDTETYYFPSKAVILTDNNDGEIYGSTDLEVKFYKNLNFVEAETLDQSEIEVENGTVTAVSGGPLTYVLTLEPTDFGEVTVKIPQGAVIDGFSVENDESEVLSLAYLPDPEPLGIHGPGGVGSSDELSYWFKSDQNIFNDSEMNPIANEEGVGYWESVLGSSAAIATQDIAEQKPTFIASSDLFNGKPAILLTGDSAFLRTNEVDVKENIASFAVVSAQNDPSGYTFWNADGWIASSRETNGFVLHPWAEAFHTTGVILDDQGNETIGLNTIFVPSINTATIHGFRYYNNSANKYLDSYVNGNLDRVMTNHVNRLPEDLIQVNFGRDFGDRYGAGMMAEQILYTTKINNVHAMLIRNYLSSKYDASCDDLDRYAQDENYGEEVAGIGQLTSYDKHLDAQGPGEVRMTAPSDLESDEFLLWGSNGEEFNWLEVGDEFFTSSKVGKTWGYDETGSVDDIQIRLYDEEGVIDPTTELGLIVLEHPNFSLFLEPEFIPMTYENGVWTTNYDFNGEGVFTFGTSPQVSVGEIEKDGFLMFPNPASNEVKLILDNTLAANVQILDIQGKKVFHKNEVLGSLLIDVSSFSHGVYTVRVTTENGMHKTQKLEVVH